MNTKSENLNRNEVISLSEPLVLIAPDEEQDKYKVSIVLSTCKVNEFIYALKSQVEFIEEKWFDRGVACEVLTPGKSWRKGKVRVSLEFLPDEPEVEKEVQSDELNESESILDDLRQAINKIN